MNWAYRLLLKLVENIIKDVHKSNNFHNFAPRMKNDFNISFNENKAINAMLHILTMVERKDLHKVFKILYFADRNLLTDYGKTITGDVYIAMNAGPVPSSIFDIIKSVRGDGYFKDNGKFSSMFTVYDGYFINELVQPNLNALSKMDLKYLNESIEKYGNKSFGELKTISHDYAWNNTVLDNAMTFEDILLENGNTPEYIALLKERANFSNSINNAC